jgi:hypothetical protein
VSPNISNSAIRNVLYVIHLELSTLRCLTDFWDIFGTPVPKMGRNSAVGMATSNGLDVPRINLYAPEFSFKF